MGSKCEKRSPKREADGDVTAKREPQQRSEDATLLALKEVAHRLKNARNADLTPEAGKKRFSEGLQRKHRTEMKNLNFGPRSYFQTFDLQNYKRINTCCFKPPNVWQSIMEATGN